MESNTARIALNGEFSSTELEEIIVEIAKARACLEPAVPLAPPSMLSSREILVQDETKFAFRKLATGGLRIWLRNEGIGWLAFSLTRADVLSIRDFLEKQSHDGTDH